MDEIDKSKSGTAGTSKVEKTETNKSESRTDEAVAMKNGRKPGPKNDPVQVRAAGKKAQADAPEDWDKLDEAVDESFPASDSSAKY
jgi:hypothetical protein